MAANAAENADEDVSELVVSSVVKLAEEEVQRYIAVLEGQREPPQIGHCCALCPFRKFDRRDRLLQHVQKYHCRERLFTANGRSQAQWNIVLTLFEQEQARYSPSKNINVIRPYALHLSTRSNLEVHTLTYRHSISATGPLPADLSAAPQEIASDICRPSATMGFTRRRYETIFASPQRF